MGTADDHAFTAWRRCFVASQRADYDEATRAALGRCANRYLDKWAPGLHLGAPSPARMTGSAVNELVETATPFAETYGIDHRASTVASRPTMTPRPAAPHRVTIQASGVSAWTLVALQCLAMEAPRLDHR